MKSWKALLIVIAVCLWASSTTALERISLQPEHSLEDDWVGSGSCTVQYYNTCTRWFETWWTEGGEALGVVVESCGTGAILNQTLVRIYNNFDDDGTLAIHQVDEAGTPQYPPLQSALILPFESCGYFGCSRWITTNWNLTVPDRFMLLVQFDPSSIDVGVGIEFPFAGPTGPAACGLCYPTTRVTRTFFWPRGPITGPGERISFGTCDLEMMVKLSFDATVPVEPTTWGGVKALYR